MWKIRKKMITILKENETIKEFWLGRGCVVSMLSFCSDDPSSKYTDV